VERYQVDYVIESEQGSQVGDGADPRPGADLQHGPHPGDVMEEIVTPDVPAEIREAYRNASIDSGRAFVPLCEIRDRVATKDRALVDQALRELLLEDPKVRLEPEAFGHRVGPRERRAAVHIGMVGCGAVQCCADLRLRAQIAVERRT
jgi:hypothetical protein